MPYLISRQQALNRIRDSIKEGECLACHIVNTPHPYILHDDTDSLVVLSQYPRTWGQTMVILKAHKTSVSELSAGEWQALTQHVRRAATMLEQELKPLRCYISSLGATINLPQTCPHIHFNVLPVYLNSDKPADLYTWDHGLYDASEQEWENLLQQLKQQWKKQLMEE